MATEASFASVLDRPSQGIVRPPACPVGDYVWQITKMPKRDRSSKKKTEFVEFACKAIGVVDGTVDAAELEAFGGLAAIKEHEKTFYMTEKSGYRLKEFLADDLKLEWDEANLSLWEVAQDTLNATFVGTIVHTPTDDNKGVYSEIGKTAPVAE